jgi:HAMP domain-containing protein
MSFQGQTGGGELHEQLAPAHAAGFEAEIVCGYCAKRRRLDRLQVIHDAMRDAYQLRSMLPPSRRRSEQGVTRSSVARQSRVFSPRPGAAYQRWSYECNKQCGHTQVVRVDRLLAAFLAAFHDSRAQLVLGVDL